MEQTQLEQKIREMLLDSEDGFSDLEEYLDTVREDYSGDLDELVFRVAVRCSCMDYLEDHVSDVDLNDEDGHSSYLYETEDTEVKDFLMDHGAFKSWEDYDECRFAMETVNGSILACDPDFLSEVLDKFLEENDLTEEKAVAMLSEDYDPDEEDEPVDMDVEDLRNALELLCCTVNQGKLVLGDPVGEENEWDLKDLIEDLGWDMEFEGDSWTFETLGVYFVE